MLIGLKFLIKKIYNNNRIRIRKAFFNKGVVYHDFHIISSIQSYPSISLFNVHRLEFQFIKCTHSILWTAFDFTLYLSNRSNHWILVKWVTFCIYLLWKFSPMHAMPGNPVIVVDDNIKTKSIRYFFSAVMTKNCPVDAGSYCWISVLQKWIWRWIVNETNHVKNEKFYRKSIWNLEHNYFIHIVIESPNQYLIKMFRRCTVFDMAVYKWNQFIWHWYAMRELHGIWQHWSMDWRHNRIEIFTWHNAECREMLKITQNWTL